MTKPTVSVVYPIITGPDWMETDPPVLVAGVSKKAVFSALREHGYRVMHVGGNIDVDVVAKEDLDISRKQRTPREEDVWDGLRDAEDVHRWYVTVHPKR